MKKLLTASLFFLMSSMFGQLGAFGELARWKNEAEAHFQKLNKNNAAPPAAIAAYNKVKSEVDQLIFQLEGELLRRNSTKIYRQLDKQLSGESSDLPKKYIDHIKKINDALAALLTQDLPDNAAVDPIAVVTLAHEALTGIAERRASKVESYIKILDQLRLAKLEIPKEDKK